ncbi:MAG: Ig domain-containing protein [Planctomycetota bacterium]
MYSRRILTWSAVCGLCLVIPACIIPPFEIWPEELPVGVQGTLYRQELSAGDASPDTWSVSEGALPPGLSLSTSTGVLSGVPATAGTYIFTIAARVTSGAGRTGERAYNLTILASLQLDATLPVGRINEAYSATPAVTGGGEPYSFDVVGLPAGLAFDEDTGVISGIPLNTYDARPLEITVTDSGTLVQTVTEQTTLTIKPPPVTIATAALADGQVGVDYSERLSAIDGAAPYTWAVVAGVLPEGLRLNTSTGVIGGTPEEALTATFTIEVTDADTPASTDSKEFTLVIAAEGSG